MRTLGLTALALVAFAANSVLCRMALGSAQSDPATFTGVRLASGAVMLALLARGRRGGSWPAAVALAAYAIPFSFAYVRLDASTGALILFAAVQLTMFGWSVARGERPRLVEWLGLGVAGSGLAWLNAPGAGAPPALGAALMAGAGVAWGAYTLRGRGAADPLGTTAGSFLRTLPFAAATLAAALAFGEVRLTVQGFGLAVASGAVTSGIGYAIWYAALRGLSAGQAGVAQLSVPVIAAFGGVVLLGEQLSPRLLGASVVILAGVAVALLARRR